MRQQKSEIEQKQHQAGTPKPSSFEGTLPPSTTTDEKQAENEQEREEDRS
jgi:hypothetical protein